MRPKGDIPILSSNLELQAISILRHECLELRARDLSPSKGLCLPLPIHSENPKHVSQPRASEALGTCHIPGPKHCTPFLTVRSVAWPVGSKASQGEQTCSPHMSGAVASST